MVEAIDRMAAQNALSRSALVSRVLAEYARMQTPEAAARQTLAALAGAAGQNGMRAAEHGIASLTLHTSLNYKYNPALSYTVALKGYSGCLGSLQAVLRSTNRAVLSCFGVFFELWQKLEQKYLEAPLHSGAHTTGEKRYRRILRNPLPEMDSIQTGQAIAGYIDAMDCCLTVFFRNIDDATSALAATEAVYLSKLPPGSPARML